MQPVAQSGYKTMMSKKPIQTIADIARLAGVSKSTVSRALNDSPLIGEETKNRIRAIAREHNFQINVPAQRLSRQQSSTIAFVTHAHHQKFSVADLFTFEILSGIGEVLARSGYDLLLVPVDPCDTRWAEQYLDTRKADGFILMTSTRKQQHIKMLVDIGAPFIAWGLPHPQFSYCTVAGDNLSGGRLAAEHLIGRGRRHIAFLGGPPQEMEVQHRYQGYEEALLAAGIEPDLALVVHGDFSDTSSASAMRKLLSQAPGLDAVFVNSDLMAISAMKVLREAGRHIPEDVAVVGYDNLSITEQTNPPLTTISQNIHLSGQLLAQNLLQYLQTGVVTHVIIPVELVVRQSS
jgi:DNA-binding LacI/PurR family transcriptional regulator